MKKGYGSIAAVAILAMMISTANAQGLLGRFFGGGGGGCDAGCTECAPTCGVADPSCGLAAPGCEAPVCGLPSIELGPGCGVPAPTCGLSEPGCGLPGMPSCGMAGGLLGKFKGMFGGGIDPGCGLPEPSCGSTGLGYGGGFGLCGGCGDGCDSCGIGGYFGRNLHQVNPCACGGSLFGDCARGFLSFFDRAVGTLVGSFFGGLQAASAHCSGTFAALESVSTCGMCGSGGCDGGCGAGGCADCTTGVVVSTPATSGYVPAVESYPTTSYPVQPTPVATPMESYPTESYSPVVEELSAPPVAPSIIEPAPATLTPMESAPMPTEAPLQTAPTEALDPFMDDPTPLSKAPATSQELAQQQLATQRGVAGGFRLFKSGNPYRANTGRPVASGYQFAKPAQPRSVPATLKQPVPANSKVARALPPVPTRSSVSQAQGQRSPAIRANLAKTRVATVGSSVAQRGAVQPAVALAPLKHRYLQARNHQATLRR